VPAPGLRYNKPKRKQNRKASSERDMAYKITNDCINCGLCEVKCPNKAIYEGAQNWTFSYGAATSRFKKYDGNIVFSGDSQAALAEKVYYIVPEKCTECVGYYDEPQCVSVCPVDCCFIDELIPEDKDRLHLKKESLKVV